MTDSSPTIVERFISMSVKAKLLPSKGGCPSKVENLLVANKRGANESQTQTLQHRAFYD